MKLNPSSYDWKDSGTHDYGFIADEMAETIPEFVVLDDDGTARAIDYSRLTSVLAAAIKEQQAQIEDLKDVIVQLADGKTASAKVGKIKGGKKIKSFSSLMKKNKK